MPWRSMADRAIPAISNSYRDDAEFGCEYLGMAIRRYSGLGRRPENKNGPP